MKFRLSDAIGDRRIQTWWSRPKNAQTEWFQDQNQHYSKSFDQASSALSIRNANERMSCVHFLHRLYYIQNVSITPMSIPSLFNNWYYAFVRAKLGIFLSQNDFQIFSKCIWDLKAMKRARDFLQLTSYRDLIIFEEASNKYRDVDHFIGMVPTWEQRIRRRGATVSSSRC